MAGMSFFRVGDNVELWRVVAFLALLIAFALCVFAVLRAKNKQLDREELVSALDLLDLVAYHHASTNREATVTTAAATMAGDAAAAAAAVAPTTASTTTMRARVSGGSNGAGSDVGAASAHAPADPRARSAIATAFRLSPSRLEQMVQTRVLRHFFLQSHGLPELFPFSKYLRQAQDNQITHMIDIEMSMWVLLILLLWAMDGITALIEKKVERKALIIAYTAAVWALSLLHVLVLLLLNRVVRRILQETGYRSRQDMLAMVQRIVAQEDRSVAVGALDSALDAMHKVQEALEAVEMRRKKKYDRSCVRDDSGLQLLSMCCRASARRCESAPPPDEDDDGSLPIRDPPMRFFSRKALHFLIKFLIMQNGFYVAFLCQAVLYEFPQLYHHFGVLAVVLIPLPLVLNMFGFQPRICRQFVVVSCIFRVDVTALSEVVTHFSESVELRSDFVSCLLQSIRANGQTVAALCEELEAHDPADTGLIELEELRQVLRRFGCQVSFFRFNGIAKLLFRLKGTRVAYAQVERLLALAEQEDERSENGSGNEIVLAGSGRWAMEAKPEQEMDERQHDSFWDMLVWDDPCTSKELGKCGYKCDALDHDDEKLSLCVLPARLVP
ncbi:hypothetical protein ATCC90586_000245 [Pythium insidiosum]|nr:hypothetical protein ATCC90586_000245 [Pythium insidiosum]